MAIIDESAACLLARAPGSRPVPVAGVRSPRRFPVYTRRAPVRSQRRQQVTRAACCRARRSRCSFRRLASDGECRTGEQRAAKDPSGVKRGRDGSRFFGRFRRERPTLRLPSSDRQTRRRSRSRRRAQPGRRGPETASTRTRRRKSRGRAWGGEPPGEPRSGDRAPVDARAGQESRLRPRPDTGPDTGQQHGQQ